MRKFVAVVLAWCTSSCALAAETRSEYYSSTRSIMMVFEDGKGYIGTNPAAPQEADEEINSMNLLEPLERPALNEGRCVAYLHYTFAILDEMRPGATFQCNGVAFRAENCISAESTCTTFQVSAQCNDFRDGKCHSRDFLAGTSPAYTFRYDLSRGLLSVDFAPGTPGDPAVVNLVGPLGLIL